MAGWLTPADKPVKVNQSAGYNGAMSGASDAIRQHVQRNWRCMEILCAKCNFLGELDATQFDIHSPEIWQLAADCFSAQGWASKEGRPICPECASSK